MCVGFSASLPNQIPIKEREREGERKVQTKYFLSFLTSLAAAARLVLLVVVYFIEERYSKKGAPRVILMWSRMTHTVRREKVCVRKNVPK